MNKNKALAFVRKIAILSELGIKEGNLLDNYLGVLLFKGATRRGHCTREIESFRDSYSLFRAELC